MLAGVLAGASAGVIGCYSNVAGFERIPGLASNSVYAGALIWNRCSHIKDPRG